MTISSLKTDEVVVARKVATGVVLGLAAVVLYFLSFFVPAHYECPGFLACISSVVFVVGLPMAAANLAFLIGLGHLFHGEYKSAWQGGVVAILLALSECWLFAEGLRVGYFMWVASMALLIVAGCCGGYDKQALCRSWGAGEATRIAARFSVRQRTVPRPMSADKIMRN